MSSKRMDANRSEAKMLGAELGDSGANIGKSSSSGAGGSGRDAGVAGGSGTGLGLFAVTSFAAVGVVALGEVVGLGDGGVGGVAGLGVGTWGVRGAKLGMSKLNASSAVSALDIFTE